MARLSIVFEKIFCFPRSKPSKRSKRSKPSSTPSQSTQVLHVPQHKVELQDQDDGPSAVNSASFHEQARHIAATPVCGMRRIAGPGNAGYIASYQAAQGPGLSSSMLGPNAILPDDTKSQNHDDGTDATLVGDGVGFGNEEDSTHGGELKTSAWQGKPNGTAYDKRQELTEEDEDMWARLAM